jgi:hypothetical protein
MAEINISKINPVVSFVFPLNHGECVGDSYETIRLNFNALDNAIANLSLSADAIWNPYGKYINENKTAMDQTIQLVGEMSACWDSTYETVAELSTAFLSPMSLVYPTIYPKAAEADENPIIASITEWLNNTFVLMNGTCRNYIIGQTAYVFVHFQDRVRNFPTNNQQTPQWNSATIGYDLFLLNHADGVLASTAGGNVRTVFRTGDPPPRQNVEHGAGTHRRVAAIQNLRIQSIDLTVPPCTSYEFWDTFIYKTKNYMFFADENTWQYSKTVY